MSCLNRVVSCTCSLMQSCNTSKNLNLIFVRFRKPRWVPKAASKIYKVREPTPIDPVEYEKMAEWTRIYNTDRKSVRKYLNKYNEETERRRRIEAAEEPFEDAYKTIQFKNSLWNNETAKIREAGMHEKAQVDKLRKQKLEERDQQEREEIRQIAMRKVVAAKEWSENYITEENLDDAIEELLDTRADHEFALHVDGSKSSESQTKDQNKTSPGS